ncbi:MAG: hypothetical protein PWQ57_2004 [Desulfovibrionales bacterium]|nr:hypothetical protein [Desulfovibrionales bacterium]
MREKFHTTQPIPVASLKLDIDNFRFYGELSTQKSCIHAVLDDNEEHAIAIAKDIATVGLTPMPIVVSKNEQGDYIVRDGNRRVTALKCLNNPAICDEERLKKRFEQIVKTATIAIPSAVECLESDDEDAILNHMQRQQGGLMNGVGHKDWNPTNKANFDLHRGDKTQNALALNTLEYLKTKGMKIDSKFPITNLQRFFDANTKQVLGISFENGVISCSDENLFYEVARRVAEDMGSGKRDVNSIRLTDDKRRYLDEVLADLDKEPADPNAPKVELGGDPASKTNPAPTKGSRVGGRKTKAAWDRKRLIPNKTPVEISTEGGTERAQNIFHELYRKIDVREAPNGAAVLFRLFIELSTEYYISRNEIRIKEDNLMTKVFSAAKYMHSCGLIDEEEFQIMERAKHSNEIISTKSLHKWVHSEKYHPNAQTLCTFWDEIQFFLQHCWE